MTDPKTLSYELERAALHALLEEWSLCNYQLFSERMHPPRFALMDNQRTLGRWTHALRLIEISRSLLVEQRWSAVIEVLKHEMAHQYVHEALGLTDETSHGPAFQRVCAERGIDAKANGAPEAGAAPGAPSRHAVLDRVAKLLALATSCNEHEAQSAMNAAQRLMLRYNLDAVAAKAERRFVSRELGEPNGRLEESLALIGVVLGEHFFVEVIQLRVWRVLDGQRGTVLEVTGTDDNVSMAEYVYSFLHHTAESLWRDHKRAKGVRGDRDRRAFRAGVISGFLAKLRGEKAANAEKGLVWAGDPELRAHYRKRYPRLVSTRSGGGGSREARTQGHEAGKKLVLTKGVGGGSSSGSGRAKQLGDGR